MSPAAFDAGADDIEAATIAGSTRSGCDADDPASHDQMLKTL